MRAGSSRTNGEARKLTPRQIERRISQLGPWFHNMNLGGIQTAPDHFLGDYPMVKWTRFSHLVPRDLKGMTVLDVGCNGGFYSIEMKRRGADRIISVDSDPFYLKQAQFAAEVSGAKIEFHCLSVYDLRQLNERFDLVLFTGVLYHLRYPLLALDLLYEHAVRDKLIFQSMLRGSDAVAAVDEDYPFAERAIFQEPGFPCMYFVEHRYCGDPTNWWIPNRAGAEAMLRSAGFEILEHPEKEVYLCRKGRRAIDYGRSRDVLERAEQLIPLGLRD
ncbi:MAG: TIGR04290 family methyltransferase [Bryobacteraceae bacterium]|nr:TIGR04290 family methyltransferase [Bryobacteraceae bacterium]